MVTPNMQKVVKKIIYTNLVETIACASKFTASNTIQNSAGMNPHTANSWRLFRISISYGDPQTILWPPLLPENSPHRWLVAGALLFLPFNRFKRHLLRL